MKILSATTYSNHAQIILSNGNGGVIGYVTLVDKNTIDKLRSEGWTALEPKAETKG